MPDWLRLMKGDVINGGCCALGEEFTYDCSPFVQWLKSSLLSLLDWAPLFNDWIGDLWLFPFVQWLNSWLMTVPPLFNDWIVHFSDYWTAPLFKWWRVVFVVVSIIVFRLWKVLISIGVLLEVWRVSFWLLGVMVCVWTLTGMCEHCLWSVSVVLFKNLSESLNLWSQWTWWVHY